ncbi:MAG: hypothetical protein AAFR51_10920 [Pseudomonadota bacterium]
MKHRKFGGLKPKKPSFGQNPPAAPEGDQTEATPLSEFKDVWCVCQIRLETGHVREGVLIGLNSTRARVRFREKSTLSEKVRLKTSRLGLDAPAKLVWQSDFDAEFVFIRG